MITRSARRPLERASGHPNTLCAAADFARSLSPGRRRIAVVQTANPLVRSSTHAFAASVVGVGIALALSIVVSRALGPAGKGTYDLVISTATLLALILGLSLPSGITFGVARGMSAPRRVVLWVLGAGTVQGVVAAVLLRVLSHTGFATEVGISATDGRLMLVLPALVSLLCIAPCLKAILNGAQRVALASWMDILRSAFTLPIVVLIAAGVTGIESTANLFVAATVVGNLLGIALILLAIWGLTPTRTGAGLTTILRFATPAYAAIVLQYLNYRLDLFLVAYFRDLREVGLYALAGTLTQFVWLVSGSVATAVFARVGAATDDPREAANQTVTLTRTVFLIQLVLAGILAATAQPLLRLLYGGAFEPAASAIWLLLPGAVALGATAVLSAHVAGLGRPDLNLIGAVAGLIVTVLLDIALIPSAGFNGAAVASTASYLATGGVTTYFFVRLTHTSTGALFEVRRADLQRARSILRGKIR
jgi:O-antigen/teichoic acid export membrane protein